MPSNPVCSFKSFSRAGQEVSGAVLDSQGTWRSQLIAISCLFSQHLDTSWGKILFSFLIFFIDILSEFIRKADACRNLCIYYILFINFSLF